MMLLGASCSALSFPFRYNHVSIVMEVSSESPRVPSWDRVGDLPVFCALGVGHLPFIVARG